MQAGSAKPDLGCAPCYRGSSEFPVRPGSGISAGLRGQHRQIGWFPPCPSRGSADIVLLYPVQYFSEKRERYKWSDGLLDRAATSPGKIGSLAVWTGPADPFISVHALDLARVRGSPPEGAGLRQARLRTTISERHLPLGSEVGPGAAAKPAPGPAPGLGSAACC